MIVLNILVLLSAAAIVVYLTKLLSWIIKVAKITANIPGPKPLPILGNALHFITVKDLEDGFKRMLNIYETYCLPPHKIVKFWLGPKLIIGLANPKHIEMVLSSEDAVQKDSIYRFFQLYFSGMFVLNGEKWAEFRKPISPLLAKRKLENGIEMFHSKAIKLIGIIDKNIENNRTFNVKEYISKCTEDVFFSFNFGADSNEMENERTESLHDLVEKITENIFKAMCVMPYCLSLTFTKMTSMGKTTIKASKDSWDVIYKMTEERKLNKKLRGVDTNETLYADLLLVRAEKENLSPEEIGKLASDFFVGGSHSLGIMTSGMILLLAMHPEHQDAIYKEQLEVMGSDPEVQPSWEQLSKMAYLTRALKEVIRLFTAPLIFRYVAKDIDLGKFTIPAGSSAALILYALHRDPTIWSHPEEFYPDHFLPEESAKRPKNSYLPFSWGPRICPGGLYALTVCKILSSVLLRKYYFKTDLKYEDLTLKFSLFMDIVQGHMVKKIPRSEMESII